MPSLPGSQSGLPLASLCSYLLPPVPLRPSGVDTPIDGSRMKNISLNSLAVLTFCSGLPSPAPPPSFVQTGLPVGRAGCCLQSCWGEEGHRPACTQLELRTLTPTLSSQTSSHVPAIISALVRTLLPRGGRGETLGCSWQLTMPGRGHCGALFVRCESLYPLPALHPRPESGSGRQHG